MWSLNGAEINIVVLPFGKKKKTLMQIQKFQKKFGKNKKNSSPFRTTGLYMSLNVATAVHLPC